MKKITVIVLAMLMILAIGQSVFAKSNIGLTVGYDAPNNGNEVKYKINGFLLGLSSEYSFTDELSFSGGVNFSSGKDSHDDKYTKTNISLFAKYDVLDFENASIGVQAGVSTLFWTWTGLYSESLIFISPGFYANYLIMPKLNIYGDIKLPIYLGGNALSKYNHKQKTTGFFKLFLYDVSIGIMYDIYDNISLGIEANINTTNNSNVINLIVQNAYGGMNYKPFCFSIGAKVGYSF